MATKTITQRIAFEGGKEMAAQLKALGDAGVAAFKRLQAAADASTVGSRIGPALQQLHGHLVRVGNAANDFGTKFNRAQSTMQRSARSIAVMSASVTGLATALLMVINNANRTADEIGDMAEMLGLSTEKYQALTFAAAAFGTSGEELGKGLARLTKQINESNKEGEKFDHQMRELHRDFQLGKVSLAEYQEGQRKLQQGAADNDSVFNRLGVSLKNAKGETVDVMQVMLRVAKALKEFGNETDRAAIKTELARAGMSGFISMLDQGPEKIQAMIDLQERLAPAMTKVEKVIHDKYTASWGAATKAVESLRLSLAAVFEPGMMKLLDGFTQMIANNREAILAWANSIAEDLAPHIRDLQMLMRGETLPEDSWVGQAWQNIKDFGTAVKYVFKEVLIPAFNGFIKVMNVVATAINGIFGTKITGGALALIVVLGALTGVFTALAAVVSLVVAGITLLGAIATGPAALAIIALGVLITTLIVSKLWQPFKDFMAWISKAWTDLADVVKGWFDAVDTRIKAAITWVKDLVTWIGKLAGVIDDAPTDTGSQKKKGLASGGYVRGPGTSRSDSILARLSTGEFVQRAAAVKYYGPNFMRALNNMAIPRSVLDGLAGFANGGLVRAASSLAPIPRFAGGGLAVEGMSGGSGGKPFILQIGGETFTGMTAEDKTFDRLQRFAVRRNIQSAGRKPGWVA